MSEDDIARELGRRLEASLFEAIAGPPRTQRQTALRLRGRRFETVELDDAGNVIEPPRPCPKCGPVLLCAEHMAMVG